MHLEQKLDDQKDDHQMLDQELRPPQGHGDGCRNREQPHIDRVDHQGGAHGATCPQREEHHGMQDPRRN